MHDRTQASIWLIDFAKTVSLPEGANITHINEWIVGNHEDGYLIGINNLIQIFEELLTNESEPQPAEKTTAEAINCGENAIEDTTSNATDCSSENKNESADVHMMDESSLILPLEIDAMKIDQTIQQSNREQSDDDH